MIRHLSMTSLAEPLEVRTCGAFDDVAPTLSWTQPRDLFQALFLENPGSFCMNGTNFDFEADDLVITPPGSQNEVKWKDEGLNTIVYFTFAASSNPRDEVALPVHTRLGAEGRLWNVSFRRGLSRLQTSKTSAHLVAKAILWSVAQEAPLYERNVYVAEAERIVSESLTEPIRIDELARKIGISQGQLSRLFVTVHGKTPLQYVRDVRAEHARHLLTTSTMPFKRVGAACGYPDPHHFNRFVRERLGASPKAIRANQGQIDVFRVQSYSSTLDRP